MNPLDTGELAIWFCDEDDPAKIQWWRDFEAPRILHESADEAGVRLGPPRVYELQPGEGRAGHPPKGIQGTNVRLLVVEADVIGLKPVRQENSFLADLDPKDLERLRKVTRRAALPKMITNEEADQIIERYGPHTAEIVLREAVNAKLN